jgi:putative endonuclease
MKKESISIKSWCVYLLECKDGSLYTGITNDLESRLAIHNAGLGAKYTRGRLPVKLLEFKAVVNQSEALKLEYQIKQLPRLKKRLLFKSE